MIRLTVQQIKETRNYVYYETVGFEFAFREGRYGVKIWVPKEEFGPEAVKTGTWPEFIDVGVLDDTDSEQKMPFPVDGYPDQTVGSLTLKQIIERATRREE